MELILERYDLKRRGVKVSRTKTEHMGVNEMEVSRRVRTQGEELVKVEEFKNSGAWERGKEDSAPMVEWGGEE